LRPSQILGALRESDAALSLHGGRFFTLFASVAARSDAATSVPGDHSSFTFNLDPLAELRVQQAGNPGVQVSVPESAISGTWGPRIALATTAGPGPQEAEVDNSAREITRPARHVGVDPERTLGYGGVEGVNYIVSIGEDFQSSIVFDANTKQILAGGPLDRPEIGSGTDDTLDPVGGLFPGRADPGGDPRHRT
jgi:hypothetical protein